MSNYLYDALSSHADSDTTALILPDGRELSYPALFTRVAQLAAVLIAQGVQAGDRVALQAPKSVDALALYLASVRVGAVFLPLNTAYTTNEVTYFLDDASPALFVCEPDAAEALTKVASMPVLTLGLDSAGAPNGSLVAAADAADATDVVVARDENDLGAILYTSGTTGRSKGAMLTHHNLLSNTLTLCDYWRFSNQDVLLHALPIYHTHGLFVASNVMLAVGGAMIFQSRFNIDDVIAELPRATSMMGVPTFYTRLLADDRLTADLVGHMRLFTSGSAPMLTETHHAFEALTGQRILERYGMTETGMSTSNPYDGERRIGSVGFALPEIDIRICDAETGAIVDDGDIGVIEVKGPNVFSGYWQMPEKTATEFRADGYFITGDLARRDSDGYITIVGRDKDLIISGGFNVYPKEIESLIDDIDGVEESAVVGVPHPDFGEAVVAVVIRTAATNDEDDSLEEQVRAVCTEQLANFKRPKLVSVESELPRNTMGKVQKNMLRDKFQQAFSVS